MIKVLRSRHILATIGTCIGVVLVPSSADTSSANQLFSPEQCEVIIQGHENGQRFSGNFVEMASSFELCDEQACRLDGLIRRKFPIEVKYFSDTGSEHARAPVIEALEEFNELLHAAGAPPLFLGEKPHGVEETDLIRIFMIGKKPDIETILENNAAANPERLLNFYGSSAGCYAEIYGVKESIEFSDVFIKSEQKVGVIKECLMEELYNSSGLFSDPPGWASLFRKEVNADYTPQSQYRAYDSVLFNVLYSDFFNYGDKFDAVEKSIDEEVQKTCK